MKFKVLAAALLLISGGLGAAERTEVVYKGVTVTSKALAAELGSYMNAELAFKGGWFVLYDAEENAVLKLKPEKLDDGSHIHYLGKEKFLSFGKFKAANGDSYFIDFYFNLKDGKLVPAGELTIYSKNDVKRYDWDEKGPVMKKLKVKKAAK